MKKVTVITLQNVRNYGSVLQAVATQKVFEDLGCQVDFINYVKDGLLSSKFQRFKLWVEKRNIFQAGTRLSCVWKTCHGSHLGWR